jgi:hypothetical protein
MYQLLKIDTDSSFDTLPPSPALSGSYDASIYSARITVRPAARVNLGGLFSYHDAKTAAFDNGSSSVVPWEGDVFSMLLTAGYSVDEKTDLSLEYLFSRSDHEQENALDGLPLGTDNRRHGLLFALSRRVTDKAQARFQYGYYRYDDEGNGGADDYRAHVFVLTVAYSF